MMTSKDNQQARWREQKRRYRASHQTFRLNYTKEEAERLEQSAKEQELKVPEYIKKIVAAHQQGSGFVLPPENQLEDLHKAILKIGSNINQLVRYCHRNKQVQYCDLQNLQDQLGQLRSQVVKTLSRPPTIEAVLDQHLQNHPKTRERIIQYLKQYDHQSDRG